ncbi:actin cortical patch SUR7/pH-response regulator pali [Protomyces lactucae-debilis]|uniref:Actin cortical patch SUR7/pH-response regulator pali n=1 Tax=Protomyces lactucae-debilis TaxID=2754530 RepID=A0A1Y2FUW1_PROLT|nr:actin cortical patch SUR7/pH-response regulator pali [Protomyces lactucae-debilis]ORY87782.1 actin cortical patch SUR7/pH-response regulator pali [Protomyces lactucae-debilis]
MGNAARTIFVTVPLLCATTAMVFQIIVLIAGLDSPGVRGLYYMRLDTRNIVAASATPFSAIINSVASQLGLMDYYQAALWTYCSGPSKNGSFESPTRCTPSSTSFWFNPVQIIQDDLYVGNVITIPQDIQDDLDLVKTAYAWLKPICIVACVFSFLAILAILPAYRSRWGSFFATIISFVAALFSVGQAVVATVLFSIFSSVINDNLPDLNVKASLGTPMFVLAWLSAGFSLVAFIFVLFTLCCCKPETRRTREYRDKSAPRSSTSSSRMVN